MLTPCAGSPGSDSRRPVQEQATAVTLSDFTRRVDPSFDQLRCLRGRHATQSAKASLACTYAGSRAASRPCPSSPLERSRDAMEIAGMHCMDCLPKHSHTKSTGHLMGSSRQPFPARLQHLGTHGSQHGVTLEWVRVAPCGLVKSVLRDQLAKTGDTIRQLQSRQRHMPQLAFRNPPCI